MFMQDQITHLELETAESQWLRLHRNENLFLEKAWLTELGKETISSLNLAQYPDSDCRLLRERLGQLYGIDEDRIFIGNGSDEILAILLHYLREYFSEAVTPAITYRVYPLLLQRYDYRQLALEKASKDRLCLIDSPNSLTGEISRVFEIPSAFLIWDNIYGEISNMQLDLKRMSPNTVIVRSFSKFYGLASLRIGYCFASREIVQALMNRKDIFNVNGFAQAMALRVLEHKQVFDSLIPKIYQARHALEAGLRSLGFLLSNSHTNCVWMTHPFVSAEVLQRNLEEFYVMVRRFSEPGLCSYLRITVPPLEKVEYLLDLIRRCL